MQTSMNAIARVLRFIFAPAVAVFMGCQPASASSRPSDVCDLAAQHAARSANIPLSVLRAITRTETGRSRNGTLEPWPWTVNMEGTGVWFETLPEARAYALQQFHQGARSFDIGCFQINYKWHGHAFSSIDEMFDPLANARYAADFLARLYDEHGNWSEAAGAYHSRTKEFARKYRSRFDDILAGLSRDQQSFASANLAAPRQNSFPLLQPTSAKPQMGSLVPSAFETRGSLFSTVQGEN